MVETCPSRRHRSSIGVSVAGAFVSLFSLLFLFLSSSIVLVRGENADTTTTAVVDNTNKDGGPQEEQEWNISQVIDLAQATLNRWNEQQQDIPAVSAVTTLSEGANDFPLLRQSMRARLVAMEDSIRTIAALADETRNWINEHNRKILQEFAERLESMEHAEENRRERLAQKRARLLQKKQQLELQHSHQEQMIQVIDQLFDPRKVLAESESLLQDWILQVAQWELEQWEEVSLAELQAAKQEDEEQRPDATGTKECLTVGTAVTQVQMALQEFTNDFAPFDHLANPDAAVGEGAIIVHELTSPTFVVPTDQRIHILGHYEAYIPEDWIPLLPSNWKEWHVPDHIWHSLARLSSFSSTPTSSTTASKLASLAETAPPETILQPSRYPGHCWPAEKIQAHSERHSVSSSSSSIAYVTIQLPYPIRVDGFTIDHVSPLLLDDPDTQLRSAPKKIRVYGYPASATKQQQDGTSKALLFDPSQTPEWLADLEYSIDASVNNVQTFSILDDDKEEATKEEVEEEKEDNDGSSNVGTCHSPNSCRNGAPIIALRIEILENWGHPDYTCFYRFRAHGEKHTEL